MEKTETKKDQDQETLFDKQSEETVNERQCRICGCTDDDYSQCINKYTGQRCHWVGDDLCSACLLAPSSAAEKDMSDLRRTEPAERKCQVCGGIDDDCNDWIEEDLCSVCWGQIEALVKRYRPAATYQNGLDPELQAMNVLSTALKPLNDKERARVLEWVIGKLGIKPMREVTIG